MRYFKDRLDLYYHGGVTEFDDYELCATVEVGFGIFSNFLEIFGIVLNPILERGTAPSRLLWRFGGNWRS